MLIFHYASLETFKSIIENHCIWLCDIQKSNDSTERTYFEQVLLKVIDDLLANPSEIKSFSPYAEKALATFKDTYRNQRPNIPPIYSASFSLNGDLLNQWHAYANDGTGLSIGFTKGFFQKAFYNENGHNVFYDKKLAISICKKKVVDNLHIFTEEYGDNINKFLDGFILSLLQFMDYESVFFKQPAFAEEQEYRIVYRHGTRTYENPVTNTDLSTFVLRYLPSYSGFKLSDRKYRISNNRLSSYHELSFDDIREHIISQIIIGPKCQTDPADIKMFLKDYGYDDNIRIQRSEIPYR